MNSNNCFGKENRTLRIKIAHIVMLSIIVLNTFSGVAWAEQQAPRFQDYPILEKFKGKNQRLLLSQKDRLYKTRLKEAAKNKPNFAGHYILSVWGCGMECVMGAVIDAKTGKVTWLPFTICCWGTDVPDNFEPIEFRLDSNLIVFSGARNEKEGDNGKHYYKFEKNHFEPIN